MKRILFVHPDERLFKLYHNHLSGFFQIDSAQNGLWALRKLKRFKPELVVSEYKLGYFSGLSLLRFIRASREFASVPFIFLSKHNFPESALEFGANDWMITSRTTPQILIERIHYHLN